MKHIVQILLDLLDNPFQIPEYRPPHWESPIEVSLWSALRFIGINAEPQVPFGNYRVDMVVSSRRNDNKAVIECDGAEYHHRIIDEFRDDELLTLCSLPIAHIYGKEIARSPERCALFIVERWFPEHMDTLGYSSALEIAYKDDVRLHVNGCSGSFPVGYVRPICGDLYPSYTDIKARGLIRYLTGDKDEYFFENEKDKELYSSIRHELEQHGLVKGKLSLQELARAYILVCVEEPERSIELKMLDEFLQRLADRNSNYADNAGG